MNKAALEGCRDIDYNQLAHQLCLLGLIAYSC